MAKRTASSLPRRGYISTITKQDRQAQPRLPKRPVPAAKLTKKQRSTITFARMFANASVTDAKYAPDVSVIRFSKYADDDGFGFRTITLDQKPPRKYNQVILAQDDQPIRKTRQIYVSCNCPRFLYYYEVVLAKKNASSIRFSNGEWPAQTNPRGVVSCCKHLLTVMRYCLVKKL